MRFGPKGAIVFWPKGAILLGQKGQNYMAFPDNDEAGRNAYLQLSKELGDSGVKASALYNGYKDLNDYLCAEFKHSEKAENKKSKGIKL